MPAPFTWFKVTRNLAPDDWSVLNRLAAAGKIESDIAQGYPYRYRILDAQCLDVLPASEHIYLKREGES